MVLKFVVRRKAVWPANPKHRLMRWVVVGPGVCPNNKVTLEFKKVQGFDRFCGRRRRAVQASERKFREKCKAANKRIYACMNRIDSKEFERANDLANMLYFQATAFCAVRHTGRHTMAAFCAVRGSSNARCCATPPSTCRWPSLLDTELSYDSLLS